MLKLRLRPSELFPFENRSQIIPFLIENVSFFVAQTVSLRRIRLHFTKTCNAAPFFTNGIIYTHSLKKQIQRIIKLSYTTYFFSFSSFKILHQLIKSFVKPTLNRVYSLSEHHFLKKRLKKLEKLKELEKLEIRPTSNNSKSVE